MCGICGFISKKQYGVSELNRMHDSLKYRGPDDSGASVFSSREKLTVGIAHRRLSIMDLSENGHQPMVSDDGSIVLTFNGEIYNFVELRNDLEQVGYRFKTKCDTEVVLKAYQEYGIHCLDKFNGMFAIALFDKKADALILARDRIGVKPLYYYFNDGEFAWGSELKPIMLFPGFHKEIREDMLARFFCHKFIKSPDSIFK